MESRTRLILLILRACEEEGEDVSLREILEALSPLIPEDLMGLSEEISTSYGDLPPRVAISMMLRDPRWRDAVEEACRLYLSEGN